MNPIDPMKISPAATRPGPIRATPVAQVGAVRRESASGIAVETRRAGGEAPVDAERVAEIRKAIDEGSYPLVPARIADAMIAASLLLRKG